MSSVISKTELIELVGGKSFIPQALTEYDFLQVIGYSFTPPHIGVLQPGKFSSQMVVKLFVKNTGALHAWARGSTDGMTRVHVGEIAPAHVYELHKCLRNYRADNDVCCMCHINWLCETFTKCNYRRINKQNFIKQMLKQGMYTRDLLLNATCIRFSGTSKAQAIGALRRARKALRAEGFKERKVQFSCLWWSK